MICSGVVLVHLTVLIACQPVTSRPEPTSAYVIPSIPATFTPSQAVTPEGASISGIVLDPEGAPLAGATVRIQATTNQTFTDELGRFMLFGLEKDTIVTVSAWSDGYYCAKVEGVSPPASGITFSMRKIQANDNPNYQWIPPTGESSCYSCKPGLTQVWLDNDAHGKSATNQRFLTMYNGTDVNGNQSPLTRYGYNRDYGRFPLRPDLTQPYYGPGYKLDFPDTAGNCAACHVPGAATDAPYATDPNLVSGVNTFGVHCDFCHKISDVILNSETGLPFPNMPGILSQDIRRPFPMDPDRYQIFFGSFDDDNVPMEDTFLPLIKQSQWCAPCHFGVFWDTVVYNSFGEWLESSYSDPETGKTCQQCHMPAPTLLDGQMLTNVAPGMGGVERDPLTIPAHTFPGGLSTDLLQNAVTMDLSASRMGNEITVAVTIVNDKTGHDVPTDSPLRQVILLVQARNSDGSTMIQVAGSTIPDYGGVGDPAKESALRVTEGYYAGLPGKIYAKVLMELWTEITPSGAYWNPTRIVSDNRLSPFVADTCVFVFQTSESSNASQISVSLLFRRAFKELMDQKSWDMPDIVMVQKIINIP